jgi:hypothetical protein
MKSIIWNPHFPRKENYSVTTCNGRDAIDIFENENFDIVFLMKICPAWADWKPSEMKEKISGSYDYDH